MQQPTTKRFHLGVIGAGRVGAVLAAGWRTAGHDVAAVAGESPASRTRIETLLPGVDITDPREVVRRADLVLLAVPDDALSDLITELVAAQVIRPDHVVVHTSGRHGTGVLEPAARLGADVIALHPAMTFTGTHVDLDRLAGCTFALTAAEGTARSVGAGLVADLGGRVTLVPEEQRTLYHAALAHGANHVATLVSQAMDLLRQAGVTDPSATLRPLLSAAVDNALAYGDAALTGPVVRGDLATVAAHLDALRAAPPATLDSYLAMARATSERAVADGRLARPRASDLAEVLDAAVWDATAAAMTA
ncbi:MAG: Rossmann-like and DUF2520 domain-containing protein [Nocardioidaceae bacterium]